MTNEEYMQLQEDGFSSQQISQISILEKHYFEVSTILEYITPKTDVNYIRNLNEIFKKFDDDLSEYNTQILMQMISVNIDPMLFLDKEYNDEKDYALGLIMKHMIRHNDKYTFNYTGLISKIKEMDTEESVYRAVEAILKEFPNIEPTEVIKDGFTERDVEYAVFLAKHGCKELIDEIPKLNEYYWDSGKYIPKILEYNFPFVDMINSYTHDSLVQVIDVYEKENLNLNEYLLNKPYSNNVLLCRHLLSTNPPLKDETIETCLSLNWKYDINDYGTWNTIITFTEIGFNLNEYFTHFPGEFGISLFEALIEENCTENQIKKYIKLFEEENKDGFTTDYRLGTKHYSLGAFNILNKEDILCLLNLYDNNYDISNAIKNKLRKTDIDMLLDISIKCDLDFEELLLKEHYEDCELLILENCVENNRYDVAEAIIKSNKHDGEAYENIIQLMDYNSATDTRHNIINLLFDKGNDVFGGYDAMYEFSCEQKAILSNAMLEEAINDKNIDVLRDNSIEAYKMYELVGLMAEGVDVCEIVKKIEDLDVDDIKMLGNCIKLGFSIKAEEER